MIGWINFSITALGSLFYLESLFYSLQLLDTTVINIFVPNHSRKKKVSVIKHAIQKLFKFLEVTMSKSVVKWRLVVGRFGRLGHGELKGLIISIDLTIYYL